MTHLDDNTLALLVDGALDEAARIEVERHLDGCATCSELVSELAWVVTPTVREAPPGYRFVRELDSKTYEATEVGRAGPVRRVAIGIGGPWPGLAPLPYDSPAGSGHPNFAEVYAIGEHAGTGFIVHELGTQTFRQWLAEAPRSTAEIVGVWARALKAIADVHRSGRVHRAVSPDHVFVEPDGRVFVGAYGREISKTSGYLAPELLADEPPTAASDQFAACVALWEALAGAKPFSGATPGALVVVMSTPPALPDENRPLFGVLARGLASDPDRRWPSIDALAAALARPPSRIPWLALAVGLVALLVALVFALR